MGPLMWLPVTVPITAAAIAAMWALERYSRPILALSVGVIAAAIFASLAVFFSFDCTLPDITDPANDMRMLRYACKGHEKYIAYAFSVIAAPLSIIALLLMTTRVALLRKRTKLEA